MVVWSVSWFGAQPAGVKVGVAHAGSLHCATSGNSVAVIPARVLCCGKVAGFSSPHERLLPILFDSRPQISGPVKRPNSPALSHSPGCLEHYKPGWNPEVDLQGQLSLWGSGVYSILSLLLSQCLTGSSATCHRVPFCSFFFFFEDKCILAFPFQNIQPFWLEKPVYSRNSIPDNVLWLLEV